MGCGVAHWGMRRGSLGGRGVWRVSSECYDGSLRGRRGSLGGSVAHCGMWRGSWRDSLEVPGSNHRGDSSLSVSDE